MNASPIFVKTYDLLKWLLPHTTKFPKSQRFLMAKRLEDAALGFYEAILRCGKLAGSRPVLLKEADIELEKLRLYLRLAQDLKLLSFNQYEYAARLVSEIGKLLGAWIQKTEEGRPSSV